MGPEDLPLGLADQVRQWGRLPAELNLKLEPLDLLVQRMALATEFLSVTSSSSSLNHLARETRGTEAPLMAVQFERDSS